MVPRAHPSHHPERHLDRFSRFCVGPKCSAIQCIVSGKETPKIDPPYSPFSSPTSTESTNTSALRGPCSHTKADAEEEADRAAVPFGNLSPNYVTRSLCVRGDRFQVKIRSISLRCHRDTGRAADINIRLILRSCEPKIPNYTTSQLDAVDFTQRRSFLTARCIR